MTEGARHLVVGRFRRPHGLKGECTVFPLTDDPEWIFGAGRALQAVDIAAALVSEDPLAPLCADPACERCAAVREELDFSGD